MISIYILVNLHKFGLINTYKSGLLMKLLCLFLLRFYREFGLVLFRFKFYKGFIYMDMLFEYFNIFMILIMMIHYFNVNSLGFNLLGFLYCAPDLLELRMGWELFFNLLYKKKYGSSLKKKEISIFFLHFFKH